MVTRSLAAAVLLASGLAALAGCGRFQDPNIVLDLRVLSMTAQPPTQVIDIDLQNPNAEAAFAQIVPTTVCALVADPGNNRRLLWSMTVCPTSGDERCNSDDPQYVVGSGLLDDPDTTIPEPAMCATIAPDGNLLSVLANVLGGDSLHGLGGIDYEVELRVGGENGDRTLDQYASKTVEIAPRIPPDATANTNPRLDRVDASIDGAPAGTLPFGRCVDLQTPPQTPLEVAAGTKLRMTPVEPDGVREVYVVPTLDGKSQQFTESLTYQWVATNGGFSSGSTGGPRDLAGNLAPLFSDYHAPAASDLDGPTDVSVWVIQRDERFGEHWYESCLHITP